MSRHGAGLAVMAALTVGSGTWTACSDDDTGPGGSGGSAASGAASTNTGGTHQGGTNPGGGTSTGTTTTHSDGGSGATGGAGPDDIPGGGTILFTELFDDASFESRGWYDGSSGTISTAEHAEGSASSYECTFAVGAQGCTGGKPSRHLLTASETVYLAFWLKFSPNWVGSGRPYHPHMFHFINDLDDQWVGPSHTYLTTYAEVVAGRALLALQDSKNEDLGCILLNDDTFIGCNGDFDSYAFTEERSVCACNGLQGDLDGRDCFANGDGSYYSARYWRTPTEVFSDGAGPYDKTAWHRVEIYFEMNSVVDGVGLLDGKLRWVQDGEVLLSYDHVLLRTGAHEGLAFNQFAMLPYIGDGSPVAQSFWVDDLVVATARP